MLTQAIILAGGFGTRLQTVVSDVPKPMAPVNGKPFLDYMLDYLHHFGIKSIVLSTGYLSHKITEHYGSSYKGISIAYTREETPLGTGGGIRLAMEQCTAKHVLVMNGDSFFDINLNAFYNQHGSFHADCSLALRHVDDAARYGTIKLGDMGVIKKFREKDGLHQPGIINAGVYLIRRDVFLAKTPAGQAFSIEKDFYEQRLNELNIFGFEQQGYFIDIGIPEDYTQAQDDFKRFAY